MKELANRSSIMQPFMVMTLLEKALSMESKGINVVHMEIGEPDFDTPQQIIKSATSGCFAGKTHYTHSLGLLELREAITQYKKQSRNLNLDPQNEILVTGGSSPGFLISLATLINPGDEVIITNPGYPCYQNFIRFFGGMVKYVNIYEEEQFDLNPERLEHVISSKTKLLILNSPANPTGQIISQKNLDKIADLAIKYDFYILSDEIYAEITYNEKIAPSISSIPEMKERSIILDGFSKNWAMTGWRLGYIIASESIVSQMNKINQNFFICAPSMSQLAGIKALHCLSETQKMNEIYQQRRDIIVKRINEIEGMSITSPQGAFYAFANIKDICMDSEKFAWDLLKEAQVAATPGIAFGKNGEGFMRFSYCTKQEHILQGMDRIEKFVKKRIK